MRTWIIKPYDVAILNEQKHYLNYSLSRARMVNEGVFGKPKGRWRVLSKKYESNPETLKMVGLASIVLHNICIEMGDIIPRNIDLTIDPVRNKRRRIERITTNDRYKSKIFRHKFCRSKIEKYIYIYIYQS